MNKLATISRIAMWVMIGALVLTFFMRGRWLTVLWLAAAIVCLVCVLLIAAGKNRGRSR